jgi:hypothetical protein
MEYSPGRASHPNYFACMMTGMRTKPIPLGTVSFSPSQLTLVSRERACEMRRKERALKVLLWIEKKHPKTISSVAGCSPSY